MDISKATVAEIQKANPELFAAIQKAALDAVSEKNGKRVGADDVDKEGEKNGERVADAKLSGVTEGAVSSRQSTTKAPLAPQPTGGFDPNIAELAKGLGECATAMKALMVKIDTSRPGEKEIAASEKKAVKETQEAVDNEDKSNGGTEAGKGKATSAQATEIGKIDTSRPGEAAINNKEKAAVKATQAAIDDEREKNDSGIGAIADGDGDKEKDKALQDELSTLKGQVSTLTKAVALMVRKSTEQAVVVEKSTATEGSVVAKAGSKQAGQLDNGGKETAVKKTVFSSAISTIALAKTGREAE